MQINPTRRSAIAIDRRKLFDGVKRCESLQNANRTTRFPPTVNKIIKLIPKHTDRNSIVRHGNDIIYYQYRQILVEIFSFLFLFTFLCVHI